ncbi:MAG: hypothetical protein ACI9C1_001981 [Candidatus Aldehydirespiratoraceae bacterium]|jgi:hypothetical protein
MSGAGLGISNWAVDVSERVSVIEWLDAELAGRARSSIGPAVPALRCTDPTIVKQSVLAAIDHCRDAQGAYRFRNDHHFVITRQSAEIA